MFNRESYCLKKVKNQKHFPNILCIDKEYKQFYINYCGVYLTKDNVPSNWKKQIQEIISTLEKLNICHNDMWSNNFLVKNDEIYLIDFGWSSMYNEKYPFININKTDIYKYSNLIDLLENVYTRVIEKRINFYLKDKS